MPSRCRPGYPNPFPTKPCRHVRRHRLPSDARRSFDPLAEVSFRPRLLWSGSPAERWRRDRQATAQPPRDANILALTERPLVLAPQAAFSQRVGSIVVVLAFRPRWGRPAAPRSASQRSFAVVSWVQIGANANILALTERQVGQRRGRAGRPQARHGSAEAGLETVRVGGVLSAYFRRPLGVLWANGRPRRRCRCKAWCSSAGRRALAVARAVPKFATGDATSGSGR